MYFIPLEKLGFCENVGRKIGIINATDSLVQNITRIAGLRWFCLWYFKLKTLETMLIYARQFFKIRLVFHTTYLRDHHFFHFWNKKLLRSRLKKIYQVEQFRANVLKCCWICWIDYINLRPFPFDEKFWFEFPRISSKERNIMFWNFRKRNFLAGIFFYLTFLSEFPVRWFGF